MFTLLESKDEIAKAQRKLETTIRQKFKKKKVKDIGYPGGTRYKVSVQTDGTYWYWPSDYRDTDIPNPRRLNWFGIMRDAKLQISVEINTPYNGRNDAVAGFFARDSDTGLIYLFHSGRIGGGQTKGVGKTAFLAWSNYPLSDVVDSSSNIRQGIVVMPIEGSAAMCNTLNYIDTIARFKRAARNGEINTPEFQIKKKEFDDFYSEVGGRRKGRRSGKIDYVSRHHEVVDALHSWRVSAKLPKGGRMVKNVLIDLGVEVGSDLTEVFEVKTSAKRPDIYCAIGQLMVHGKAKNCRRIIVLPHGELIATGMEDALRRVGIELLHFKLDDHKATIV